MNNEYLYPRQCLRSLFITALDIPLRRIFSIIYLILHLRYRRKLCIIALLSCLHLPPRRLPKLFIISPPTTCAPLHPRLNHVLNEFTVFRLISWTMIHRRSSPGLRVWIFVLVRNSSINYYYFAAWRLIGVPPWRFNKPLANNNNNEAGRRLCSLGADIQSRSTPGDRL